MDDKWFLYNVETRAARLAREGDPSELLKLLRSGFPMSPKMAAFLADYLEGKFAKQDHRPRRRPSEIVWDWFKKPNNRAANMAHHLMQAWRSEDACSHLQKRNGRKPSIHEEAARMAIDQFQREFPNEPRPNFNQVMDLLRRKRCVPPDPISRNKSAT